MPEPTRLVVDTTRAIADTSRRQIGINLNYLRDDDRNLPGARPLEGFDDGPASLERYLENAVSWVRYANITRQYGVRYWEIGNENWQSLSAEECADLGLRSPGP